MTLKAAMKGMLDPVYEEKVIGHAEVRQIFKASGVGNIAGSYVLDGKFQRGCTGKNYPEMAEQIYEGPRLHHLRDLRMMLRKLKQATNVVLYLKNSMTL